MHSRLQINGQSERTAKLVGYTAVFTLLYEVFGGAARYFLADIGGLFINNVPSVLTLLLLGVYLLRSFARHRIEPFMAAVIGMLFLFALYALFNGLPVMQSVFGFYIWTLFLLGTLVCVYECETILFHYLPLIWLCAVTGVFLNVFIAFPWTGTNYEAYGVQMETARDWTDHGVERLAGFSRASFSAAASIIVSCAYILATKRFSIVVKAACYALSILALYLTTSKTEIIVFTALPILWGIYKGLQFTVPRSPLSYLWARFTIMLVAVLIIVIPLTLDSDFLSGMPTLGFFSSNSMVDRVLTTWPDGFRLLSEQGNYILGRGLGGIGAAQQLEEPGWFTYGDNLFVYVIVTGGLLLAVPLFAAFFRGQYGLYQKSPSYFEIFYLLNLCLLGIGITGSLIEFPSLAVLLGFVVARSYIVLESVPAAP